MSTLEAIIMGLIQGLTEYLPVSSSGHLAIAGTLFGLSGEDNLSFTIAVHVATVLATLVVLWREVVWLFKGLFRWDGHLNEAQRYILCIVVSMIGGGVRFRPACCGLLSVGDRRPAHLQLLCPSSAEVIYLCG